MNAYDTMQRPVNKAARLVLATEATMWHGLRHGWISGPKLRRLARRRDALSRRAIWQPAIPPTTA